MTQKTAKELPTEKTAPTTTFPSALAPLLSAVGRFADKFGVSFAMLVLLFFSVWWMGSSKTKDDFLRELLFAEITHSHYLQGIVAVLTLDAVFGVMLFRSWMSRDRRELKRCAEEKARLQELLAGRQLAHTEKLVRDDATKFS